MKGLALRNMFETLFRNWLEKGTEFFQQKTLMKTLKKAVRKLITRGRSCFTQVNSDGIGDGISHFTGSRNETQVSEGRKGKEGDTKVLRSWNSYGKLNLQVKSFSLNSSYLDQIRPGLEQAAIQKCQRLVTEITIPR